MTRKQPNRSENNKTKSSTDRDTHLLISKQNTKCITGEERIYNDFGTQSLFRQQRLFHQGLLFEEIRENYQGFSQ